MVSPFDIAGLLQHIAKLVNEMEECDELCRQVYQRLAVINDKLLALEKQRRLPRNTPALSSYSELVLDFQAFLTKNKCRSWVYRVVMSRRIIGTVRSFQERIVTLMLALDVVHFAAMTDERAEMERFRAIILGHCRKDVAAIDATERTIMTQLTSDATVARAVVRDEQQREALSVLQHELRKTQCRTVAGRTTTAAVPVAAADQIQQQTLVTALDKVMRRSTVDARAVASWFCPPQDVEYDEHAFARGSFGTVHRGRLLNSSDRDSRDIVVKRLLVDTRSNDDRTARFREEATLWFSFDHPHVLAMLGACDVSSPPFLVCELASNGNLFNYVSVQRHRPQLLRLLYEAATGLVYLHTHSVVHGDLKCDNILVSADEHAKIADFSFSYVRALSASQKTVAADTTNSGATQVAGAVRWRAPECLLGRRPTFASDVFSFGMCILEAVSHEVPWGYYVDDDTVRDLVTRGEMPEQPVDMSDRLWRLVTRMCSLDPRARRPLIFVVTELRQIWQDSSADTGIIAPTAPSRVRVTSEDDLWRTCLSGSPERPMLQPPPPTPPTSQLQPMQSFPPPPYACFPTLLPFRLDKSDVVLTRELANLRASIWWLGHYHGQPVVVKRMVEASGGITSQLVSEIETLARLTHPHIIRLFGCTWSSRSDLGSVTEFMEGGDLRSLLAGRNRQCALSWRREKRSIAVDVAQGLAHMHSLQPAVAHMRVQSHSVLLSSKASTMIAKLANFNLAQTITAVDDDGTHTVETVFYSNVRWAAPEVLRGEHVTVQADVYSFGVLLTELDTCLPPFETSINERSGRRLPDTAILIQVSRGSLHPSLTPECPGSIKAIVLACLHFDPTARPSSAELVKMLTHACV